MGYRFTVLPVPLQHLPSTSALLTMLNSLTVWITTNRKILQEMGIPEHLTYLLRNLYADQEATVRTGHGITDWFQIGKGVHQGCILSPCLFNLYADYIMQNAGLREAQAEIKISGRIISNLRYTDDTTFMAESEEELKSLLMFEKMARIHRTIQKNFNDPDHEGVITHLEPDILECEVKWALGSITTKRLVEAMEFKLSHFKS